MLDYIFFTQSVCDKLCRFLAERGIDHDISSDNGVITVSHTDDLSDDLLEQIESYYDELFDEESAIINDPLAMDAAEKDLVGVGTELADGRLIQIRLPADITRRLLNQFTTEEVRKLVNDIAAQVENPIDGPLCKDI